MPFRTLRIATLCLIWFLVTCAARAQYILPYDTLGKASEDSAASAAAAEEKKTQKAADEAIDQTEDSILATPKMTHQQLLEMAEQWLRRLLYRGVLDTKTIGAYANYQLTAWSEAGGSYGPVEARVTVSYLGSLTQEGKTAEWLQAIFQAMDEDPMVVEFDFLVTATPEIREISRVYYRINRGAVQSTPFADPSGMNMDSLDRAADEGPESVRLYSGNFEAEKYRGVGDEGQDVVIYRVPSVPPLGIVRLGYGDQGLTYIGGGNDAAARFLPPGTR